MSHDIAYWTCGELTHAYASRSVSPVEVVSAVLERVHRLETHLNAFQLVDDQAAMADAESSERRWRRGRSRGPLDGIPVSVKDLVMTRGWPTLSGSRITNPAGPWPEDAPAVACLRAAGCVLFGKTTTPEFGWKGMTDSPLKGITRNPWDLGRTPGGSSGGAGAALAAGLGPLALGTDGGGSIRIPASHCGVYGLKPTFGRIPSYPTTSPYSSVASAGPMARRTEDLALGLQVMARPDHRDWYALPASRTRYAAAVERGVRGMKIALSIDLGEASVQPDIERTVREAASALEEAGARVEEVGPVIDPLRPAFEAKWLLGFAYRLRAIPRRRWAELDPGFRVLAERGLTYGLGEHLASETATIALGERFSALHARYDLLVTPTLSVTAPPVDLPYASPANDRWRHGVPFTLPFNLTGQPAGSVPCGRDAAGLPIGVQVVGPKYAEDKVLRGMGALERAVGFDWKALCGELAVS